MTTARATFRYRVTVNTDAGWRQRVGNALRILAWWIDGRFTLAVSIDTTPPLPAKQRLACLDQAHPAIERAVESELRIEVLERLMRQHLPWTNG